MVSINSGSRENALETLTEALTIAEKIGSKRAGQSGLEVSAGFHILDEEWNRAAVLFGAAQAHMAHTGLHRDPTDESFLAPLIEKARGALGESVFAAAEATGRELAYEGAIAQAQVWLVERGR
jgi:non-specific serine/threonine protein kinase